jgi:hypothetical protein
MSIQALKGVWWKKVDRSEKLWLGIALAWCLILFAMMPLWHWKGGQNPSFETYRTPRLRASQAFVDGAPRPGDKASRRRARPKQASTCSGGCGNGTGLKLSREDTGHPVVDRPRLLAFP